MFDCDHRTSKAVVVNSRIRWLEIYCAGNTLALCNQRGVKDLSVHTATVAAIDSHCLIHIHPIGLHPNIQKRNATGATIKSILDFINLTHYRPVNLLKANRIIWFSEWIWIGWSELVVNGWDDNWAPFRRSKSRDLILANHQDKLGMWTSKGGRRTSVLNRHWVGCSS